MSSSKNSQQSRRWKKNLSREEQLGALQVAVMGGSVKDIAKAIDRSPHAIYNLLHDFNVDVNPRMRKAREIQIHISALKTINATIDGRSSDGKISKELEELLDASRARVVVTSNKETSNKETSNIDASGSLRTRPHPPQVSVPYRRQSDNDPYGKVLRSRKIVGTRLSLTSSRGYRNPQPVAYPDIHVDRHYDPESGMTVDIYRCVENNCRAEYKIDTSTANWYSERKLEIPRRCEDCRGTWKGNPKPPNTTKPPQKAPEIQAVKEETVATTPVEVDELTSLIEEVYEPITKASTETEELVMGESDRSFAREMGEGLTETALLIYEVGDRLAKLSDIANRRAESQASENGKEKN